MTPLILRLDIAGMPVTWISWQDAVNLYCRDMIAWTAGNHQFTFHGGVSRLSGLRSLVEVNSIIAVKRSSDHKHVQRSIPPLQSKMPLLAIPYVPNWAEFLALSNRRILMDQMEFLKSQFSGRPMAFYRQ